MRLIRCLWLVWAIPLVQVSGASKFWVGGGSANTWAATANTNWSATSGGANNAAVPGAADDVFFDGNSGVGNSVVGANATIKSLTTTGYTGTLTVNAGFAINFTTNVTLNAGATFAWLSATSKLNFTGSGSQTFTSAGAVIGELQINGTGTLTLQDTTQGSSSLVILMGTLNTNGKQTTFGSFSSTGVNTRALTLGASVFTVNNGSFTISGTGVTVSALSSTIVMGFTGSSATNFTGAGLTYGNLSVTGGGTGAVSFIGANVFATFTIGAPKFVIFSVASAQTMTSFVAMGSIGNIITITSSSAGTPATLSQASGTVSSNYLTLKDSSATGGAIWYAGAASTNVSGNSGWIFCNANSKCTRGFTGAGGTFQGQPGIAFIQMENN